MFRRYSHRFGVLVLIALLALVGCRSAASEELVQAEVPGGETLETVQDATGGETPETVQEATGKDAPVQPGPEATRPPTLAPTPAPSTEDLLARIPTPPANAIIPTPASFRSEGVAVRGSADAPITIIEFSDYQCPFCLGYINGAYPEVLETYVESGQVRYIFKDFPLEGLHPQATKAAEASHCAGEQGLYWEMHDQLFANQDVWGGQADPVGIFVQLGGDIGLDQSALESCLESERHRATVQGNLAEGQALGVSGTPTFFVDGYPVVGNQPIEIFDLALALVNAGRMGDAYAQVPTPTTMPPGQIELSSSPTMGASDAPVVMIEYSDYQCPFCSRYQTETFPLIKEAYIDSGKVQYIFKDFPLDFHAQANLAAQAARCAGDQGDFWGMHDLLFGDQGVWSNAAAPDVFRRYADQLGLDGAILASCLDSGEHADAVIADIREGYSVGVTGTPAFFVNGRFISGAQPYEVFQQTIEAALAGG